MLNSLRASATSIWAKILLSFLVLSFGIWGIGDVVQNSGRDAAVAKIGSKSVTASEFQRAMHMEGERFRRMMGDDFAPAMLKNPLISQHVLQQLINQSLLKQEAEALGLIPSDADVVRRIRSSAAFQDSKGNFDKTIFEGMLRRSNMTEKNYVDTVRQEVAVNMLVDTLSAAAPESDTAARMLLEAREEARNVTLYSLKPSLVSNIPAPDEAQLKSYYESHSRDFTAQEYRTISYITLSLANVKNAGTSEEDLKALYKEHLDDYKRPERRAVEQLLYSSEESARKASELLKSGKSFADVAKQTDILNKDSLSLGKVERSNVLEAAADKVFSLASGGVTEPVQSPFGWHVFHVSAIEPPAVQPLEEVRSNLEKELKQRGSDDALSKLANQLQDALAGGTTLQDAAKEFGLKVATVGPVDHQGKTLENAKSNDIPDLDKFLEVSFKTDDKAESQMMTSKGGTFYIVHVDKIIPERLRTLDEVKGLVVSGWQKEEREKRLNELAMEIGGKFLKDAERSKMIDKYNLQPVTTTSIKRGSHTAGELSLPPGLVSDVFSRKPQEGSTAYAGKNGEYLVAVLNSVSQAPSPDKDAKLASALKDINEKMKNTARNEILLQYTQHLEKKYPVTVNDSLIQAILK